MRNRKTTIEQQLQGLLTLYNHGEWEAVVEKAKYIIRVSPAVTDAYNFLGAAFHKLNNFQKSVTNYQIALILDPKQRDVYNNLGNTLVPRSQNDSALTNFKRAIVIDPKFAHGLFNIGNFHAQKQEFNTAIAYFERILDFQPGFPELYNEVISDDDSDLLIIETSSIKPSKN